MLHRETSLQVLRAPAPGLLLSASVATAAAPTWTGTVTLDGKLVAAELEIYEHVEFAGDSEPCRDPDSQGLSLMDFGCTDAASGTRLAELASKATPARLVTGVSSGSDGRFNADPLAPGRYGVSIHVIGTQERATFVVDVAAQRSTTFNFETQRPSEKRTVREVKELFEGEQALWFIGRDNPRLTLLREADAPAVTTMDGEYRVVSANGSVNTAVFHAVEPWTAPSLIPPRAVEVVGTVRPGKKPGAKAKVAALSRGKTVETVTDASGTFKGLLPKTKRSSHSTIVKKLTP